MLQQGFFILRNSDWTRAFLKEWWRIADRTKVCDQDAFNMLYSKYLEKQPESKGVLDEVVVLPMNIINSHPPAMVHQSISDRVLHLMGESTEVRSNAFRIAFDNLCNRKYDSQDTLTRTVITQLGLTKNTLQGIAGEVYRSKLDFLLHNANSTEEFDEMIKAAHHYIDLLRVKLKEVPHADTVYDIKDLRVKIFKKVEGKIILIKNNISLLEESFKHVEEKGEYNSDISSGEEEIQERLAAETNNLLHMLKRAAESGNDLFWACETYVEKHKIAEDVLRILKVINF